MVFDNVHSNEYRTSKLIQIFRKTLWKVSGLDGRYRPRALALAEHAREAQFLGRGCRDFEAKFAQSRKEQQYLKKEKKKTRKKQKKTEKQKSVPACQ